MNQQILQFRVATTLVLSLVACRAATEPATPGVVPAGAMDAAWANIGKNCTPASPVKVLQENKRDSLPPYTHGPTRSVDDDWADAARLIPGGWGGLWLEAGVPTMYLVDTGQRNDAISGLQARGIGSTLQLGETVVKPGRWDFAQLADWYRYLSLHVLFSEHVRSSDIDEVKNRIELEATGTSTRAALETLLASLDLPCYLVAIDSP